MGLREKIRSSQDIITREIFIPEWEATVRVKTLTALERARCSNTEEDEEDAEVQNISFMVRMIVAATVGEDGSPLFREEDLDWLRNKSYPAINRLFNEVAVINGATAEAAGDLRKNLPPTPPGGSDTA